MKKIFAFIFGTALVLTSGASNALAAPDYPRSDSTCTNATLIGEYGNQSTGTIIPRGKFPPGAFAASGFFKFDGQGNLSGDSYASFNGQIVEYPNLVGTYQVNENCIVELKVKINDSGDVIIFKGPIVNNGEEIRSINLIPYTVITNVIKKVNVSNYRVQY